MIRSRLAAAVLCFGFVALGSASGFGGATAFAQQVRPTVKGRAHRVKVDSSPQQAAVYWSAGSGPLSGQPKDYGIAGYTPITLKVPRGAVTFVIELQGFKPQQKALDVADARTDAQRRQSESLTARDKRLADWYQAGRRERETVPSAPARGRAAAPAPVCTSTNTMTCVPKKPRTRTVSVAGPASAAVMGKARN